MTNTGSDAFSATLPPLKAEPGLFDPTAPPDDLSPLSCERFVWGVDASTLRVSIAVDAGPPIALTKSFTKTRTPTARLAVIWHETREVALQLALSHPPARVVVEQPSGKFANPPLMYATGVIQAALVDALDVPLSLIAVSKWKAASVGHGGAKKPQILAWAQRRGYTGRLEDEADALGVAVAATVLNV